MFHLPVMKLILDLKPDSVVIHSLGLLSSVFEKVAELCQVLWLKSLCKYMFMTFLQMFIGEKKFPLSESLEH